MTASKLWMVEGCMTCADHTELGASTAKRTIKEFLDEGILIETRQKRCKNGHIVYRMILAKVREIPFKSMKGRNRTSRSDPVCGGEPLEDTYRAMPSSCAKQPLLRVSRQADGGPEWFRLIRYLHSLEPAQFLRVQPSLRLMISPIFLSSWPMTSAGQVLEVIIKALKVLKHQI